MAVSIDERVPPRYLDRPDQWDALTKLLVNVPSGLDSEFYGVDLGRNSTETVTGRGTVHVWSVALQTKRFHPRGYHLAQSYVLPVDALFHQGLRRWLCDPGCEKWAHNKGMEIHAIENTWRSRGVPFLVAGVRDTLSLARWCLPARVVPGQGGYALDDLGNDCIGRGKADSFEDVLSEPNVVAIERRRTTHRNVCQCGDVPCRRRGPEHVRERVTTVDRWTEDVVRGTRFIPLDQVVPGHERWARLIPYAGVDAELALELREWLLNQLKVRELPW